MSQRELHSKTSFALDASPRTSNFGVLMDLDHPVRYYSRSLSVLRASLPVLAGLAWLVLHAPAGEAQPEPPRVPRDAAVVAGPTESGARLVAFDHGRALCADVRRRGEDFTDPDCDRPTGQLRKPFMQAEFDGRGRRTWHWGAVAPEVASVELVFRRGPRVAAPTEAGSAYRGRFAGKVRFFIAEARGPEGQMPLYIRQLGADGTLLAVTDFFDFRPLRSGPIEHLASGHLGTTRWRLRAFARWERTPLPGDEERFTRPVCVDLATLSRRGRERGSASACAHPDYPFDDLSLGTDQSCATVGAVVTGVVSPRVTRVVAVLGDGRARPLRLRALPSRLGNRRAFALVLRPATAVRRVVAFGAGGRRIESHALGLAPGGVRCGEEGSFLLFGLGEELSPPRRGNGPPSLLLRDEGVLLCAAIGAFDRRAQDCAPPPIETFEARLLSQATSQGTLIAAVLPREVAAVEFLLDGEQRQRVVTTSDGPYSGRYRGLVRIASLRLPGRRRAYAARLIDDRGRTMERLPGPDARPLERGFVALARAPGGLRLGAAVARSFDGRERELCLVLGHASPAGSDSCGFGTGYLAELESFCRPRQLVLWGRVRDRRTTVAVRTDRGVIRGRVVGFPRRFGFRGAAFLVVVPRQHAVRQLIVRRRRTARRQLRLPPPAKQCGYADVLTVPGRPHGR